MAAQQQQQNDNYSLLEECDTPILGLYEKPLLPFPNGRKLTRTWVTMGRVSVLVCGLFLCAVLSIAYNTHINQPDSLIYPLSASPLGTDRTFIERNAPLTARYPRTPSGPPTALRNGGHLSGSWQALNSKWQRKNAVTRLELQLGGDPKLTEADVSSLRPTQLVLGFREVEEKVEKIKAEKNIQKYLEDRPVPVVVGPNNELYIIDHHHLVRAAMEAGISKVFVTQEADLSALSQNDFWNAMKEKKWVYLLDENGQGPHPPESIPKDVRQLKDDPFRSVAWAVRERGGFDKIGTPFSEFHWANYFRRSITTDPTKDFKAAVEEAMQAAKSDAAKDLPGYKK